MAETENQIVNLVTGGTGIVGTRIMFDLLEKGQRVKAFKRESSNIEQVKNAFKFYSADRGEKLYSKINWVEGELLDVYSLEDAIEGCDYIYHCAAMVSFHPKDAREMYLTNQKGTENIVNSALSVGIKHFCHISSIAALGRAKEGAKINENTDWIASKYNSYYAITKYGAEQEVWRGMEEGLDAVVVNPGIIFGAGTYGKSSSSLFSAVNDELKFHTKGSGSFVDVRDVSRIAIEAVSRKINKERFVLVSENRTIRSVI